MISIFKKNNHKQLREKAQNWLRLAEKVYHFRKDIIDPDELKELMDSSHKLSKTLDKKGNEDWGKVRLASEELELILKKTGGYFYPNNFFAENAEMFLVAAIVALAIRTFFLQPFKIPTNSMYPTYNGMTYEIYHEDEGPSALESVFRKATLFSQRKQIVAESEGELLLPVNARQSSGKVIVGRKLGFFKYITYDLIIGETVHPVKAPLEFRMGNVFKDNYASETPGNWNSYVSQANDRRKIKKINGNYYVSTGIYFNKGDKVLDFEVLTGDALFVDRMSYHFLKPDVGDAIVFRTGKIKELKEAKYYIKRLVGTPGDTLQIKPPELLRNGEAIDGVKAFEKNMSQDDEYPGYVNIDSAKYLKTPESTVTIPEDSYFAMGDNSPYSLDSRYWGFVPKEEMVGKALFIYYPFTKRWGISK